jgi:hypothetical protein
MMRRTSGWVLALVLALIMVGLVPPRAAAAGRSLSSFLCKSLVLILLFEMVVDLGQR